MSWLLLIQSYKLAVKIFIAYKFNFLHKLQIYLFKIEKPTYFYSLSNMEDRLRWIYFK